MACVVFRCTHVKIRLFAYSGERDRPFRVNVIGFGLLPESSVTMLRKTHPISGLATTADQLGKRTTPFVCDTDTTLEEFEITLPGTVKVQALPRPVLFEGPTIRFESNYRQVGTVTFVTRKAIRNRPKEWCSPHMWEESESLSSAISRDARGQVLLQ
jgi:hypothetical protein